jgi:hypothetical protein
MADSFGLDAPLAKEQHFGLDAPIVSLGDVAATPDVFTEGAAQAAATPTPLAPQLAGIGRGIVGVGEAGLNLGTQMVSPVVAGLGGLTALGTNALGLTNANPADVVAGVNDTLNYQPQTEAGQIATNAATYPFQKLAEAGRFAGEHVQDATGSPVAATAVDTLINAMPILAGVRGGLRRGAEAETPEPVVAETPPVDTTAIKVEPPLPPATAEPPPVIPPEPAVAATLPETPNAPVERPEVPPEVPGGDTGERASSPVDGQGEVAAPEGAKPPPNWTFDATKEIDGLPAADAPAAHDVAELAARAQDAGLKESDIEPFHDETDAEYTDRIASELTAYEERQRGTEPAANEADNRQDVRGQAGPGEPPSEPASTPVGESVQASDIPRSETQPAAAANAETAVAERPVTVATKAATDEARAARGVYELPQAERHEWAAADSEAKDRLAKDPTYGSTLAAEVVKSKRPVDDVESMALLNDRVRLQGEHAKAVDAVTKAEGDPVASTAAKIRMAQIEEALTTNEKAGRQSKSSVARSLNATKAGMTEDYSLAHTIARAKIAFGDKFGEATRKTMEDLAQKLKDAEAEVEALKKKSEKPPKEAKKSPDEKMQAKLNKEMEKLEGQIKQRLTACPI